SSSILTGRVRHRRRGRVRHALAYRFWMLSIDLDEAARLDTALRLFGLDRAGVFSLRSSDYGPQGPGPLKARIVEALREHGFSGAGPVRLLTVPRILGHAFNPISVFLCHDAAGGLEATIYEVHNTFGERHSYLIAAGKGRVAQEATKDFHVSPFLPGAMRYRFLLDTGREHFRLVILDYQGDELVLTATLDLKAEPLGDFALARRFLANPLFSLKIIAGIHWEALKLWIKGASVTPHVPDPAHRFSRGEAISPHL
ncbi:MAG: DUF1365 domain-containing protein, partial [Rhizobiaceae bacterium]